MRPNYSSNRWLGEHEDNTTFVFVHGVLSDPVGCWFNEATGAYWPQIVKDDSDFGKPGVFLGGYSTGFTSGGYGIRDCAQELFSGLSLSFGDYPPVLEHERIVFVCHSLGGIVTRYMLEAWRQAFQTQAILLVLIASPSLGSKYAVWLESVVDLFGNRQGKQLAWRSEMLEDLDRRFKDLKESDLIPRLKGYELIEQKFPVPIPGFSPIVSDLSASRYFGDYVMVPGSDHMSIVKPPDAAAFQCGLVKKYFQEFDAKYASAIPLTKRQRSKEHSVPTSVFECQRLNWSIRINPHGDGHNEMAFDGISAVRSAAGARYQMATASVDAGYLSRYIKDAARTSPDVRLEQVAHQQEVKASVCFDQQPSREMPQKLVLQMLDFHAYALDREGLESDLDYAEKSISFERIEDFLFEVCFPENMSLSRLDPPFVLAYQSFPGSAQNVLDAALTRQAAAGFHYSPMARTAYLRVTKPPLNSTYRVCWRLGDPQDGVPRPTDSQIALAEARRAVLLEIRDLIGSPATKGANPRRVAVLTELAKFGAFAGKLLQTALDAPEVAGVLQNLERDLEINVMAVETRDRALKFIAGTGIGDLWTSTLRLGEGIAGRAATWLQSQYYDDERARDTVGADSYVELAPGKRHAWLLSIPLYIPAGGPVAVGVLNIGTFNDRFARILRALNETGLVQALEKEARETLLPAILRA